MSRKSNYQYTAPWVSVLTVMPYSRLSSLVLIFLISGLACAEDKINISPLPSENIFELFHGDSCGCSIFKRNATQSPENVLLSFILDEARIQINGQTVPLSRVLPYEFTDTHATIRFRGEDTIVTAKIERSNNQELCSYSSVTRPWHTCKSGQLSVNYQYATVAFPIIEVCGC